VTNQRPTPPPYVPDAEPGDLGLHILIVCAVIAAMVAISVIAIAVYVSFNESAESRQCRENLTPGYECVKTYTQVPKRGVNE
jgi:hypothetical protein